MYVHVHVHIDTHIHTQSLHASNSVFINAHSLYDIFKYNYTLHIFSFKKITKMYF